MLREGECTGRESESRKPGPQPAPEAREGVLKVSLPSLGLEG